jgi:biopolymer transport protein ExbD
VQPVVEVRVLTGGGLLIEGRTFTDANVRALETKIAEINRRNPRPAYRIRTGRTMRFEDVGRAIVLLQRVGLVKVGFITEPDFPAKTDGD